jgi:hypothetical protein
VDIILDEKERRTCATGIQVVAISDAMTKSQDDLDVNEDEGDPSINEIVEANPLAKPQKTVRLYDLGKVEMPSYDPTTESGTYLLFPYDDSVPISSVQDKVEKLVVLDIKWARQGVKMDPGIAALPKVHLDAPPAQSHFWRWHNSGAGMLSTIEAIYFAAMEITTTTDCWTEEERERLVHIMWLFALQHSVILQRSQIEQRILPFSAEEKSRQRVLRQKQKGNPPKNKKKADAEKFYKDLSF